MKYFSLFFLTVAFSVISPELFSQFKLDFGEIAVEDLANNQYLPDPGADAIKISDIAIAKLDYDEEFYIQLERNVRIRIVNSNGFDYANIEVPFLADDRLINYKASTFNTRNGDKIETPITRKSFIIENTSSSTKTLKFNFPDVHEGSIIEYSYIIKLRNYSIMNLVPWEFQSEVPVIYSSITVVYPDAFTYKNFISGSAAEVKYMNSTANSVFFGQSVTTNFRTWTAENVPAFRAEPKILSRKEHLKKITFELARLDFPKITISDISPTYKTLTDKLLERSDFGTPLSINLKSLAEKITSDAGDDLSKLKKIHEYISSNILWNGVEDFTASSSLRNVLRKEKGNSADINMILIVMLRSLGIKADPVILSTRSNGHFNQNSAMLQQFNYLVAYVSVDRKFYLVDATDPLRPFNILPFNCLNGSGRLISEIESKFVDLNNNERRSGSYNLELTPDSAGNVTGHIEYTYSDYSAYDIRSIIKLESEEGYLDILRSFSPNAEITDYKIKNLDDINSDLLITCNFKINNGAQIAGDELIFNPFQLQTKLTNPFFTTERKFPVDFGCNDNDNVMITIKIPAGYTVIEKPEDANFNLGKEDGKFEFNCNADDKSLSIKRTINISKLVFQPDEYSEVQKFYLKAQSKQSEYIVFKRNMLTMKDK